MGPGAHGRLQLGDKRIATSIIRLPERWREAVMKGESSFVEFTPVSDEDAAREHLLMNLRVSTCSGVPISAAYQARWGSRPSSQKVTSLMEQGLLTLDGDVLAATPQGRLVLNAVIAALLN